MRKWLVPCFLLCFTGCQSPEPRPIPVQPEVAEPEPTGLGAHAPYQPNGREEFVFAEQPEPLQHFGYGGFCPTAQHCDARLPYGLYVGKRGYFEKTEPQPAGTEWDVNLVVLETSERYYYFAHRSLGGRYGTMAPVVPLERISQVDAFQPQPLVPCSMIDLEDSWIEFGQTYYRLSNGRKLSESQLGLIRRADRLFHRNSGELTERLLDVQLSISPENGHLLIGPLSEFKDNDIRLYIELGPQGPELRLKVKYFGEQWLYLRALEFSADSRRWEARRLRFRKTNTGGQIEEWADVKATPQDIRIVEALATADDARVRFEGARFYDELVLTEIHKEDILRLLELYRLMQNAEVGANGPPEC